MRTAMAVSALTLIFLFPGASAQTKPDSEPNPAQKQKIRVSERLLMPLEKKVEPVAPTDARGKHPKGTVILAVTIDEDGSVSKAIAVSGKPTLAAAAIEAVKQWKYEPFLLNGKPVIVEATLTVKFEGH